MVHACCFHTGSASFCVACRNDSTIFSPCQPFLRKKLLRTCGRCERPPALCAVFSWSPLAYVLLRTCGRRERPPALCAVWARSPLAYVKGSLPFDRSLWHRPSLRRTQATRALRAPERRKKRVSPHPAAVPAGPCSLSQSAEAPLHAPAPAAVGASPRPPLAPWVRASPPPLRASVSSGTQETRLAAPPRLLRRASRPHHPSEVWRAAALQAEIRIQRHARWIRQPCASKATLRRPPPGEPTAQPLAK